MTFLSRLPISLSAKPGEPAFSLLARNTEANGRRTLAEFCAAVGMEKNPLCAGDPGQVAQLAALTGSDCAELLAQSPRQIDRKYTDLLGQRFLTDPSERTILPSVPPAGSTRGGAAGWMLQNWQSTRIGCPACCRVARDMALRCCPCPIATTRPATIRRPVAALIRTGFTGWRT